jgi:ParB-like chromosome segregation protein Spo0J
MANDQAKLKLVDPLPQGPGALPDPTKPLDLTKPLDPTKPRVALVKVAEILAIEEDNVREEYDEEGLEGLAQSLQLNGQSSTIVVEPISEIRSDGKKWLLIAGFRRMLAAEKAGIEELFAVIRTFPDRESAEALNIAENVEREDVALYSYCKKIRHLLDKGWTPTRIVTQCGFEERMGRQLVSFVSHLAPELLIRLKYDEGQKTILRLEWIIKHIKGSDKQDTFKKQIECWNTQGWKSKAPPKKRKERPADPETIVKMAQRVQVARGLQGPGGEWVALTATQTEAIVSALLWCAAPRSNRSPL